MRYIALIGLIALSTACLPEGEPNPSPDAGFSDIQGDRCGGCEYGECHDLEVYGWSCVAECKARRCSGGEYCTNFYGGDFTQYKCTQEPLIK